MATKTLEKIIGAYFSRLVYAVFKDIGTHWTLPNTYNPLMYQTYDNLIKDDQDSSKLTVLSSRFTVSVEVKQHLVNILLSFIADLQVVEFQDKDTTDDIPGLVSATHLNTISLHVFSISKLPISGKTLLEASEPKMLIHSHLMNDLQALRSRFDIVGSLHTAFDRFLKSMAFQIGRIIWYSHASISNGLFLGVLSVHINNQTILDELSAALRPKPPAKPRKPKIKKIDDGDMSNAAVPASNAAVPASNADVHRPAEPAPEQHPTAPRSVIADAISAALAGPSQASIPASTHIDNTANIVDTQPDIPDDL